MKYGVTWIGQKYEMEWFEEFDKNLLRNLKQVYGFLFDDSGKFVIVSMYGGKKWALPGGGPEKEDRDWKDTIIREAEEEVDVEVDKDSLKIVGLIKVNPVSDNCERGVHYLLRVAGKIKKVNKQTVDPARGEINLRKFVEPENFESHVSWGEFGVFQMNEAIKVLGLQN